MSRQEFTRPSAPRQLSTIDPNDWQAIAARPDQHRADAAPSCSGGSRVLVAAFLAGPVRSLLTPAVHRTIQSLFWDRFGGSRVVFARLYDVHALDAPRRRQLLCVLSGLSGGRGGEWSAPLPSGKSFLSNASTVSRCRFAGGSQLAQNPYMVQSLERQLATLRACYDRMLVYERRQSLRFDWILRTRTDTAFLKPARPHCNLGDGLSSSVLHARSFSKGTDVHHMFADHAAIVPRQYAEAFFVGIGERLSACTSSGATMPPSHSEPESFIHHSLIALGATSSSVTWLAPLVVSIDGRMPKWCGRYLKLGVSEAKALGQNQAACAEAILNPVGKWAEVAAGPRTAAELRDDKCRLSYGAAPRNAGGTINAGACTKENGCCLRHPRLAVCQ